MPLIYELNCDKCHAKTGIVDYVNALVMSNGGLKYLPHPGEPSTLEKLGTTANEASALGKLVRFQKLVCLNCGMIDEYREGVITFDIVFCIALIGGFAIGGGIMMFTRLSQMTTAVVIIVTCFAMIFLVGRIAKVIERWRGGRRRCPKCDGKKLQSIGTLLVNLNHDFRFVCQECGARAAKANICGMS